jgi:uncharacterized protein (DUF4415 family)
MRRKLLLPTAEEEVEIARGIAKDPDAAPDLSRPVAGIIRVVGRPKASNPKVSVTLRLDRDVVDRFKSAGAGWQTRINAALRRAVDA